ncbi:hypothetical protein FACS189491_02560 [Spirochaetia bacterium]|nr:hypothetical protein FACS189491_02560 [Spirochaetia bacterium]
MKTKKIKITDINNEIIMDDVAFLCCASFEDRSIIISNAVSGKSFKFVYIFANLDYHQKILQNANIIKSIFGDNSKIVSTKIQDPLLTGREIQGVINTLIKNNIKNIILDISTFTHEMLLILLMAIYENKKYFDNIMCIYMGAKDYSINETIEKKWLSKGCKQIRTVIGYPGKLIPSIPICLIVLVGYEHERAAIMIEEMDPEFLILGKGLPSDDSLTNSSHKAPMLHFQNILTNLVSRRGEIGSFDFSCRNLQSTFSAIEEQIRKTEGFNHIIVPLNTKISTLAVGLAALKNKNIQVCYAEPETYNFQGYSLPDDEATLIGNILELF